jgi:hypothetical protein
MDPVEGRFVLHGHLRADGPVVAGALTEQQVGAGYNDIQNDFLKASAARARLYHGPVVLRFQVDAAGRVETCDVLMDRVVATDASDVNWPALSKALVACVLAYRFPQTSGPTVVIQPFLFGDV